MRTALALCAAAAAFTAAATVARADPFDATRVPADAKWVVHLDMDAARPTELWHAVDDRLSANEGFQAKIGQLETASGMHYPRDVHDLTVYGRAAGDDAAVTILHATMDREQLLAAVQLAPNYASELFGKYDLVNWDDNGKAKFAAFHDKSTIVIAGSADLIKSALDVLDDKAPRAAADGPLVAGGGKPAAGQPATLVYLAVTDPTSLGKPGEAPNPIMKQVESGCLTVTERPSSTTRPVAGPADADAAVHVSLRTRTPEAAQQLQTSLAGIKAIVSLAAMGRAADPRATFAAAALRSLKVTGTGATVEVDTTMNVDRLQQAADRAIESAKKARGNDDK